MVVIFIEVEKELYELYLNWHNPIHQDNITDLASQEQIVIQFFIDSQTPVRRLVIPNPLIDPMHQYIPLLKTLPNWTTAQFDQAKQDLFQEYPSSHTLFAKLKTQIKQPTTPPNQDIPGFKYELTDFGKFTTREEAEVLQEIQSRINRPIPILSEITHNKIGFVVKNNHVIALDLNRLSIPNLPPNIGCLTYLESLDLRFNDLHALPDSFGQLTQLKSLDLGSNPIESFPESITNLTNLKLLGLRYTVQLQISPTLKNWINKLKNNGCDIQELKGSEKHFSKRHGDKTGKINKKLGCSMMILGLIIGIIMLITGYVYSLVILAPVLLCLFGFQIYKNI
jgi:hypothetical protein